MVYRILAGYRMSKMEAGMMHIWDMRRCHFAYVTFYFAGCTCTGADDFEVYTDVLFRFCDCHNVLQWVGK